MPSSSVLVPIVEASEAVDLQERLLRAPVQQMGDDEIFVVWCVLDHVEKLAKARKGVLRERLLTVAEEEGDEDAKGHRTVEMEGGQFVRQRKVSVRLVPVAVQSLLTRRGIDPKKGGDYVFVPNEDKLADLLEAEMIDADDLAECATEKETFALVVGKKHYPDPVRRAISQGGKSGRFGRPE